MALDYSQKQLLNQPLSHGTHGKRVRQLQIYAVITGFISTLISLATLIVYALK
jgi:hypothetical protein